MDTPLHTPGPWAIDLESKFTLGGDTRSVEALTPDGKMVTREICTLMFDTDGWPDSTSWQEDVANAVLIQAAPDFRAATAALFDRLAKSDPDDLDFGRGFVQWEELAALKAALVKATTLPQNAGYGTRAGFVDEPEGIDD